MIANAGGRQGSLGCGDSVRRLYCRRYPTHPFKRRLLICSMPPLLLLRLRVRERAPLFQQESVLASADCSCMRMKGEEEWMERRSER